jgi:hypothetical protein
MLVPFPEPNSPGDYVIKLRQGKRKKSRPEPFSFRAVMSASAIQTENSASVIQTENPLLSFHDSLMMPTVRRLEKF